MVKVSSWGSSRSIVGSRDRFLVLRFEHTGLYLDEEAVAKLFSTGWLPRWNPWYFLSCRPLVEEIGRSIIEEGNA